MQSTTIRKSLGRLNRAFCSDQTPQSFGVTELTMSQVQFIGPEVSGLRRYGAASLDLAWVAAGRLDGFWEDGLASWDAAAGILLVREAGGFVTDYRGSDRAYEKGEYVAASGAIHSRLQKLIASAIR